ncbi:MAG: DUF1778 domain-containing protein [Planctomycetes bacterium]|nr:DUF1778 domain-containing protein [Planctomycetota bacterium]MCB9934808.1 DUF1778 domain-containing protein [Planctomycetota bacterium]
MLDEKKESVLQTRLSVEDKRAIQQAAALRGLAVSEYVRQVLVPLAKREVARAEHAVIELSAVEQLALWHALDAPAKLTKSQKSLAKLMRSKARSA